MRSIRWISLLVIAGLAVLWCQAAAAQEARAAEVAALCQSITSEEAGVRTQAFKDLVALGSDGLQELLGLLVEPGQGNDAGARFALHGWAMQVSRPRAEDERLAYVNALIEYLAGQAPTGAKQFVIAQLQIAGRQESVPVLAACLRDEQLATFATQALMVSPRGEAAAALRAALAEVSDPVRVGVIEALGYRRDRDSVGALLEQARSEAADVRVAAAEALARIGDRRAEPVVAERLGQGSAQEQRAVFDAYLRLGEALTASDERAEALRVYTRALAAATGPAGRCAALVGVSRVGTAAEVRTVLPYLADGDAAVRQTATRCLVELPDPKTSEALAEAMKAAEPAERAGLLRVLAQRKEPAAEEAIRSGASDTSAEVRVAAHELLGTLGEAPEEDLLEAATEGSDAIHPVALGEYLRRAGQRAGEDRAAALQMLTRTLGLARTDGLVRAAVRALGAVGDLATLTTLEPLLGNGAARDEVLRAAVSIGVRAADAGQKERAAEVLISAVESGAPREASQSAVAKLRELGVDFDPARASGFVTTWWVIGPFPGGNVDTEYPPEGGVDLAAAVQAGDREARWQQHHTGDFEGIVNLLPLLDPNQNVTAYLYAEVNVDAAQDVLLKMGSDDGMVCWLNGERIHRAPQPRSLTVDQDTVEARLNAGANKVLLKVAQGGGDWSCCLRLTDRDGKAIQFAQREQ